MDLEIFEAIMLICFGIAWPFSIYKLIETKKAKGKSIPIYCDSSFGLSVRHMFSMVWR